jgi:hypothetical protein
MTSERRERRFFLRIFSVFSKELWRAVQVRDALAKLFVDVCAGRVEPKAATSIIEDLLKAIAAADEESRLSRERTKATRSDDTSVQFRLLGPEEWMAAFGNSNESPKAANAGAGGSRRLCFSRGGFAPNTGGPANTAAHG